MSRKVEVAMDLLIAATELALELGINVARYHEERDENGQISDESRDAVLKEAREEALKL